MTLGRSVYLAALLVALLPVPAGAITVSPGQSIQAAIDQILSGATLDTVIDVRPGTYAETLTIRFTNRSFTLRSTNGPGVTTINATGSGRTAILMVATTGSITIQGFTVTGGVGGPDPGSGGGFTVQDSSPVFVNCVFQGNRSLLHGGGGNLYRSNAVFQSTVMQNNTAVQFGGGIFIGTGSSPTLTGSTIASNTAGTGSAHGAGGGVALVDASATLRSSTITGNASKAAGGGVYSLTFFSTPGPTTLVVEDSDVVGNTTSRFNSGAPPAAGGGIHIEDNVTAHLIRTKVRQNVADDGGGISTFRGRYEVSSSTIESNTALDALGQGGHGGGIVVASQGPAGQAIVNDSVIRNNSALQGGGISSDGDGGSRIPATVTVQNSLLDSNTATTRFGGGIYAGHTTLTITGTHILRNRVLANTVESRGGGLLLLISTTTLTDVTIADNSARIQGGGIYVDLGGSLSINQSRIYRNVASGVSGARGGGLFVGSNPVPTGMVQNSDFADNTNFEISENNCPTISPFTPSPILTYFNNRVTAASGNAVYHTPCVPPGLTLTAAGLNGLNPLRASGNTSPAPTFAVFAATPDGEAPTVLSWTVARATAISIAPTVGAVGGANVPTGTVDVTPSCTTSYVLTGTTPTGDRVLAANVTAPTSLVEFGPSAFAYHGAFTGGVFVAAGDMNGDGRADIVTSPGAGGGPHVRAFLIDNAGNFTPFAEFLAYTPAFTGGLFVAAGDVSGDGARAEIITGAGQSGGPHVRIFQVSNAGAVTPFAELMAYTPTFTGGVRVAAGNVDVAGTAAEVLTVPGPGGGPHVRVFKVSQGGGISLFTEFFAYAPDFMGGLFVSATDVDADGIAEIITAPGAGGGPHMRVWKVSPAGTVRLFSEFLAYDSAFLGGVFVAGGDVASAGGGEIVTGVGVGGGPHLRVLNIVGGVLAESIVYPLGFTGGVRVAVGNVNGSGAPEIVTGAGPGGGPHVRLFRVGACP